MAVASIVAVGSDEGLESVVCAVLSATCTPSRIQSRPAKAASLSEAAQCGVLAAAVWWPHIRGIHQANNNVRH